MAIQRNKATDNDLDLTVNNGDFVALREAVSRLGFKDEESALRFAIAILTRSATRAVTVTDQNGTKISLNPSPELLTAES